MAFEGLQIVIEGALGILGETTALWVTNILIACLLLLIGVLVGKFSKWLLKMVLRATRVNKLFKHGLMETSLTIAKWVIYVVFLQAALVELQIPTLSGWLQKGLHVIPSLVGSILILIIGFSLGRYLQNSVEKVEGKNWKLLGQILYLFFVYMSVVTALSVAFNLVILKDARGTLDTIVVVITAIWGAAVAWNFKDVGK
jgi:hypothetical protein